MPWFKCSISCLHFKETNSHYSTWIEFAIEWFHLFLIFTWILDWRLYFNQYSIVLHPNLTYYFQLITFLFLPIFINRFMCFTFQAIIGANIFAHCKLQECTASNTIYKTLIGCLASLLVLWQILVKVSCHVFCGCDRHEFSFMNQNQVQ